MYIQPCGTCGASLKELCEKEIMEGWKEAHLRLGLRVGEGLRRGERCVGASLAEERRGLMRMKEELDTHPLSLCDELLSGRHGALGLLRLSL
jgi:hypothetical protein